MPQDADSTTRGRASSRRMASSWGANPPGTVVTPYSIQGKPIQTPPPQGTGQTPPPQGTGQTGQTGQQGGQSGQQPGTGQSLRAS